MCTGLLKLKRIAKEKYIHLPTLATLESDATEYDTLAHQKPMVSSYRLLVVCYCYILRPIFFYSEQGGF